MNNHNFAIYLESGRMHRPRLPDTQLQEIFRKTRDANDYNDVERGFRAFSAHLVERGLIRMDDYVSVFGGQALHQLTLAPDGRFIDMRAGCDATALVRRYSRAKYGSIDDIRYFASIVIQALNAAIDDPQSGWRRLFETAKVNGDQVVMMTTGWRNVPSTANVLYDLVIERVNLKLAHLALPTIINVKLPRIAPPCENYASLTLEERKRVSAVQDHVIPDRNFYGSCGVHVIFGDDVLVTGATADKVFFESMRNGAKSFRALYPVALDPIVALSDPATEEALNTIEVKDCLDDGIAALLSHADYTPILRTLRLVFSERNRAALGGFLHKVPALQWRKLYVSALNNDFHRQPASAPSLALVMRHLIGEGMLDERGTWTDLSEAPA